MFEQDHKIPFLKISNIKGKIIFDKKRNNNTKAIEISSLEKGIYFLTVIIAGKNEQFKIKVQ